MKNLKRILLLIVILAMTLTNIPTLAETPIKVTLDGKALQFDVQPQIINSRTFVPMRAIFEAMGATVEWYSDAKYIIAKKGNIKIAMQINNNSITKNEVAINLGVAPQIINGRTLVPVRAVAESFNATVDWDSENSTVKINQQITTANENEIKYYTDFPTVPDFGALSGAVGVKHSNSTVSGYFYNSLQFNKDKIQEYIEVLGKAGFIYSGSFKDENGTKIGFKKDNLNIGFGMGDGSDFIVMITLE